MEEKIDRSYLRAYVGSILQIPDGPEILGNMIAHAETVSELYNYEGEDIALATKALLAGSPYHPFGKFADSVSRDPRIWPDLVQAFSEDIGQVQEKLCSDGDQFRFEGLRKICERHKDLKSSFQAALMARGGATVASPEAGNSPSPSAP